MPLNYRITRSFRETFRTLFSPLTLFIWATAILGGTIAGPFGTFDSLAWPGRTVFWAIVVSVAVVVGYALRAVSLALIGARRPVLLDITMVALMTMVLAPLVWFITSIFSAFTPITLEPVWVDAGYVMVCTGIVIVGRRLLPGFETTGYDRRVEAEREPAAPEPVVSEPRLLRRLEPEVRGEVLRLSANDHVVDVVTALGQVTLRMRFLDAIAEMEPVHGYCVHRSHWVAHGAIEHVVREHSYKLFVVLGNGDRIPVSRKYRRNLEEAGLF